jgi:hypothetical protein
MKPYHVFLLLILIAFIRCNESYRSSTDAPESQSPVVSTPPELSDSLRLMMHLDSLPEIKFPFRSEFYNRRFSELNLSEFKNKKLFDLSFQKIPRVIGNGSIDMNKDENDSSFNLVDSGFIARWNLIVLKENFIVIEVQYGYIYLATLTYNLDLIDAIRTGYIEPTSNDRMNADRHAVITKDLTVLLQHQYNAQIGESFNYQTLTSEEKWFIDKSGHFKKEVKMK